MMKEKRQDNEWGYYEDLLFCGKIYCINKFIYWSIILYNKKEIKCKKTLF